MALVARFKAAASETDERPAARKSIGHLGGGVLQHLITTLTYRWRADAERNY